MSTMVEAVRAYRHARWLGNEPGIPQDEEDRRIERMTALEAGIVAARADGLEDAEAALSLALEWLRDYVASEEEGVQIVRHLVLEAWLVLSWMKDEARRQAA